MVSLGKFKLTLICLLLVGIFFRLYHIEFGLPHSFYADEPEITEPAIKYTYEFKDIILHNNYYKLIPGSFVYGTLPVYFFTFFIMAFSKFNNFIGVAFDKTTLFIFMRVINSLLSLVLFLTCAKIYKNLFKENAAKGVTVLFFLLAVNWKLIVHSHYVNPDLFLTVLLNLSLVFTLEFFNQPSKSIYLALAGAFYGLAFGTKITALLTFPLYLVVFYKKSEFKAILGFVFIAVLAYVISNPFSIIFLKDFSYRVFTMLSRENGLVFDSVDYSLFKYLFALGYMATPLVALFSVCGIGIVLNSKGKIKKFYEHILLIGYIVLYTLFFSVSSRRVDRWLLPVIPIILIYASYALVNIKFKNKLITYAVYLVVTLSYLYFPILLLTQFKRQTPKSEAYLWLRDHIDPLSSKLAVTEEGLDPLNKLSSSTVIQFEVYAGKNAQLSFPPNPLLYNYVVLSSRPMTNFKRPEIAAKYSEYSMRWSNFENLVENSGKFVLIKDFKLPKPNLIPLSDVNIYQNTGLKNL